MVSIHSTFQIVAAAMMTSSTAALPANSSSSRELSVTCSTGHNLDIRGNDYISVQAQYPNSCCSICRARPVCKGYTWTSHRGGTCWLKRAAPLDAFAVKLGAESCIVNPGDMSTIVGLTSAVGQPTGKAFFDCDMPGNDLKASPSKSPDECLRSCLPFSLCKAATWTNANGGTCYFKTDVRDCVYKKGATTTVAFNQVVTAY